MELAQAPHHDATQDTAQDNILAAFLEPGALADVARRANMSLAALAAWTAKHAELLESTHKLLVARCKLIAAQLELSALSSLAAVSTTSTPTDDAKLRERSLERQRKAASAILRHRIGLERIPSARGASSGPHAPPTLNATDQSQRRSGSPNAGTFLDALIPSASMPSSSRPASRTLATLNTA